MFFNIILLFTVLFILVVGLNYSNSIKENFFDVPDIISQHQQYINDSQVKFNSLTNMVNLANPSVSMEPISADNVKQALATITAQPTSNGYKLESTTPYTTPDQTPKTIQLAQQCETATTTCDAFNDPTFAANCGMSFDLQTKNSAGQVVGPSGLYVSPSDRTQQTNMANNVEKSGSAPYDPYLVYQPTIGKAKPGTFGITKDKCAIVKEKVDCLAKQTFGSPHCTQCYTTQRFARVGPEAGRLPSTLYLYGDGSVTVSSSNSSISLSAKNLSKANAAQVTVPANSEGTQFTIAVSPVSNPAYVCGYLKGQTPSGIFTIDLMNLIQTDTVTNTKPRITGTNTFDGFRSFTLMPGNGKTSMNFACLMPFSFVNMYDGEALSCSNGPIITQASSATFLESDPCYGAANSPGKYKLECLQSRWIQMGGTTKGTGYPVDSATANAIQRDSNGNPLNIDTIVDNLSVKMAQAQTGNDSKGNPLSIPDWNEVSMYTTGVPINTPCDGPNNAIGPLSKACLSYLYTNKGTTSRVGPTYTQLPAVAASSKEGFSGIEGFETIPNTFNYPGTIIDPNNESGVTFGQSLGGVAAVQQKYDAINRLANDNTKKNAERATALKQAYDITLGPASSSNIVGPRQVFAVGPNYQYTRDQASNVCAQYGASVASTAQLQDAYINGADWCFSGWVADGGGKWPITTSVIPGCGGTPGLQSWTPDNNMAGVTCYGPKPGINNPASQNGTIKPFNQQMWNQPNLKEGFVAQPDIDYLTVQSGYLETTGPQPACFTLPSIEDAQKGCAALGSQCTGFSYAKDGSGFGCYKGNHNAGMNSNPAYKGYVKIPVSSANATTTGRYIKFIYNRTECLNLAQIRVYSKKDGPNIITPDMWTQVTKSSGYQGDMFPVQNFVNGNQSGRPYNFVHTSCYDVPWIQVDLGTMTTIYKIVIVNRYDCCQSRIMGAVMNIMNEQSEAVYISNPVSSTNTTYTWYPPNPSILVDQSDDLPVVERDKTVPPPGYSQGPCRPGYYDKTRGSYNWWGCGAGCPGGTYFTDGVCNCSCIPNSQDP